VNATVTIDKAGRLILPKSIRAALRIGPGDALEIETAEDRIVLSPVRVHAGLQKERGVWVYRSGNPVNLSIPDLIDEERERRTRELMASARENLP
jgi:AbrB family looped-hinge helix DNA binding protein